MSSNESTGVMLDDAQIERYSRQIILPEVGGRGQERLLQSHVALIGSGPLGRLIATYLAGAGVGRLDWYSGPGDDSGAGARLCSDLAAVNPDTDCHWHAGSEGFSADPAHVVIAAVEDSSHLARANHAALSARVPLVAGCVRGTAGWLGVFAGDRPDQACVECATPTLSSEHGAARDASPEPAAAGVVGSLQALEALNLLLDPGTVPLGRIWHYDGATSALEPQPISKRAGCPACGTD